MELVHFPRNRDFNSKYNFINLLSNSSKIEKIIIQQTPVTKYIMIKVVENDEGEIEEDWQD